MKSNSSPRLQWTALSITLVTAVALIIGVASSVSAAPDPLFTLAIKDVVDQIQGRAVEVDVQITCRSDSAIARINLSIAYDIEALSFAEAIPGELLTGCGWTYFNYTFGPAVDCKDSGRCGTLNIVAASDDPNGSPACPPPSMVGGPASLVKLRFLVTNDREYACHNVPLRFVWRDCADNTVVSKNYQTWYHVAALHEGAGGPDIFAPAAYPSYTGTADSCFAPNSLSGFRSVEFYNAKVGLICEDTTDYRGDVNCNGLPLEIADYITFVNYLLIGESAFGVQADCSLASSDVNADGVPAGLDDLLCLCRLIGEAGYTCSLPSVIHHDYTYEDGILGVDGLEVGLARIVVPGDVVPTWLLSRTDFSAGAVYDSTGDSTVILILPTDLFAFPSTGFSGQFLDLKGATITTIEMVTPQGAMILRVPSGANDNRDSHLPAKYELSCNYPNPFNPSTVVQYSLPRAGAVRLLVLGFSLLPPDTLRSPPAPPGNGASLCEGRYSQSLPV
jgi:hypothetical protein